MQITAGTLATIAGRSVNSNMQSTIAGLERAGVGAGLNRPHRLAQFLARGDAPARAEKIACAEQRCGGAEPDRCGE